MAVTNIVRVLGTRTDTTGTNRFQGFTRVYMAHSDTSPPSSFLIAAGSTDASSGGTTDGQGIYPDFSNVPTDGSAKIQMIAASLSFFSAFNFDWAGGGTNAFSVGYAAADFPKDFPPIPNFAPTPNGNILVKPINSPSKFFMIFDILHA